VDAIGLSSIVLLTVIVLGVLLVVLAVIAVVVLLPPVRRALAERSARRASDVSPEGVEHDDRGGR